MMSDKQNEQITIALQSIPENAQSIRLYESVFTTDVFVQYTILKPSFTDDIEEDTVMKRIDWNGNVQDDPRRNMVFDNIADRVHFFNNLRLIK